MLTMSGTPRPNHRPIVLAQVYSPPGIDVPMRRQAATCLSFAR